MNLEPAVKTSEKTNKIAGIVIAIVAGVLLTIAVYLQVAHIVKWWPFG